MQSTRIEFSINDPWEQLVTHYTTDEVYTHHEYHIFRENAKPVQIYLNLLVKNFVLNAMCLQDLVIMDLHSFLTFSTLDHIGREQKRFYYFPTPFFLCGTFSFSHVILNVGRTAPLRGMNFQEINNCSRELCGRGIILTETWHYLINPSILYANCLSFLSVFLPIFTFLNVY